MKKSLSLALAAALTLGMTSCLGGQDEDITTGSIYMYNFVVPNEGTGEDVSLKQAYTSLEINHTQGTMDQEVKAVVGEFPVQFKTGKMQLNTTTTGYVYTASVISSTGLHVSNFNGRYDPRLGLLCNDYEVGGMYHVYSIEDFAYNFATLRVYDAPGGNMLYERENVGFALRPDCTSKDKECILVIANFALSESGNVMSRLSYSKLKYQLTKTGFTVTGDDIRNVEGYTTYDTKDVNGSVTNYGQRGTISFKMDDKYVEIIGTMFYVPES